MCSTAICEVVTHFGQSVGLPKHLFTEMPLQGQGAAKEGAALQGKASQEPRAAAKAGRGRDRREESRCPEKTYRGQVGQQTCLVMRWV